MTALVAWILTNPTILAIGAGIVAVAAAFIKGRLAGASSERNKRAADDAAAASTAKQIDEGVAGNAPADNRKELGEWSPKQ